MSARPLSRTAAVYSLELSSTLKRPLFWSLLVLLFLGSWLLSTGGLRISSGDSSVGGTKAWLTSEFAFAQLLAYLVALLYGFFASIAAGTVVTTDDDQKVGEVLHSTPLRPGEYVWGKFLAIATGFLVALGFHVLFSAFFNHVVPNAKAAEIRGPFELVNYLRPALVFALPMLVFLLGVSWYFGERWRRPLTVFLFPIVVLTVCGFFLWTWAPSWLDPRINRALMLVDPTGFRWLSETWLKLDRGAKFYNTQRIELDLLFILSRVAFVAIGLLAVALSQRHLTKTLRRPGEAPARRWMRRRPSPAAAAPDTALDPAARLSALGMRQRAVGFLGGVRTTAATEVRNLLASPALYLFSGLILIQVLGGSLVQLGAFQTRVLLTPGLFAVGTMGELSFLLCALLMFYTVESIERDQRTGFAAIAYATPQPTAAILFGKAVANSLVGLFVLLATFIAGVIALLIQGTVPLRLDPFLLVWGLLLVPTFLVWTSFVTAVQAVTGQRYASYGICLGALALTVYFLVTAKISWVGNWPLWGALRWSDLSLFELDRRALVLNRLFVLALAVLFTAVAAAAFERRQPDAIGTLHRLAPGRIGRRLVRFSPLIALPLILGILLFVTVRNGLEGSVADKKAYEYWKQNLATWLEAPQPSITAVDLDLRIEPERRWLHQRGSYELINDSDKPLSRFALSGRRYWTNVHWTLDGKPWKPLDHSTLWVFTPPAPLPPGGKVRVGFEFEGAFMDGVTKNGGNLDEFALPGGTVLTSFTPSFAPVVGFRKDVGITKDENDYEPKDYPPGFWEGKTDAAFGANRPFPYRIRITGPAEYIWNSVGVKTSESVSGGKRTVVWQSDRPIRFFNVVGGRWKVKTGQGTAIYYNAAHPWNIEAMSTALDAARRWYSEWFHPYPWRELKLSEFPGLAGYAQGFPTNITFSENIGFLTKSDEKTDAVFFVTAHESAHQWWGNILTPGEGPGGNILSEGMSNFSTLLLMEQVKGPAERMELAKRFEEQYGDSRHADAERPLAWVDGSRDGDQTVTYNKGGWAFWMLLQHMGRERALAGLRQFITEWSDQPDHPVIQDFLASMRPFAPDPAAFDAFTHQWFLDVVVPEYRLSNARKTKSGAGWEVTVRVRNAGTGRMPVEVAATHGERFTDDGKPVSSWRAERRTVVLGAGEEREVRIACPFEPDKVVVDPDVQVLQLRRKAAVTTL
jgi:ABC-type transport system involved in multi-copper enzyme maturation permease subunit